MRTLCARVPVYSAVCACSCLLSSINSKPFERDAGSGSFEPCGKNTIPKTDLNTRKGVGLMILSIIVISIISSTFLSYRYTALTTIDSLSRNTATCSTESARAPGGGYKVPKHINSSNKWSVRLLSCTETNMKMCRWWY